MNKKVILIAGGVVVAGVAAYLVWKNRQPEKLPAILAPINTKTPSKAYTEQQKKMIAATTSSSSDLVFGQKTVAGLGAAYAFS